MLLATAFTVYVMLLGVVAYDDLTSSDGKFLLKA